MDTAKNLWNQAQNELKISMEKEISMMREILANMHQEELSLLTSDKTGWNLVMQKRFELVERLGSLRNARIEATQKIQKLASPDKKEADVPLDKLLPIENEESYEILMLRDQIMALTERMNFQNSRNENLFEQVKNKPLPPYSMQPKAPLEPKKGKTSIATYDRKAS